MPDFSEYTDTLHADLTRLGWAAPERIRAAGTRRARTRLVLASSALAVVVVLASSAGVLLTGRHDRARPTVPPVASGSAVPSPSLAPSAAASPTVTSGTAIPQTAMLTSSGLLPPFVSVGEPFDQPEYPNPFQGCTTDGLPGPKQPVAALGTAFGSSDPTLTGLLGGESVLQYDPGAATQVMATIDHLARTSCSVFQVARRDLGGNESVLLTTTDHNAVGAQAIHGLALYYAIIRYGDYLVWVTVVDQSHKTGDAALAGTLAQRAGERLCREVAC
jgi:hypothetical protein